MEIIDKFDGRHAFLSNFFPCTIEFEGMVFKTSEHAFQAAKTLNLATRQIIQAAPTPGRAKRLGKGVHLRFDWEEVKIPIMREILSIKFDPVKHSNLRRLLEQTRPAELVEGNNWNDTFWGVCNSIGENNLGKLLMEIRDGT